ncbi:MAG: putative lipid II flippase FtsW [Betaproteobacteria bacterium]|nr:putative lipid II flippase FtsW [Betaproteobacteria bacterium]
MLYSSTAKRSAIDPSLFWSVLLLLSIGLVMVYSASIAMAEAEKVSGYRMQYFLVRHCLYLAIGGVAAATVFQVPVAIWQRLAPWLFIIGGFLLVIVLIPGIGREVNHSRRWLPLVVMTMQPSELMKLFAVLYAADYTVRKAAFMHDFKKGFLPMLAVMVFIGATLLCEPDFGALVVITSITMAILFLGGLNWRVFLVLIVSLLVSFAVMIVTTPYRLLRFASYLDPWADPLGKGYQLSHSLIAFGRGEWLGVGLGASVEKLFYLPEAHTDFLLAVVAEELGFAGVAAVLILFVLFIYRAFAVGREAMMREKYFAALVAQGIAVWICVQAFINMGVNMGLLPTKGLTLPFLSYGGTGILVNCMAVAILLRIDWENRASSTSARKGVGRG